MPKAKKDRKTGKMKAQRTAAHRAKIRAADKQLGKAAKRYKQTQRNIAAGSKKKVSIWSIFFGK